MLVNTVGTIQMPRSRHHKRPSRTDSLHTCRGDPQHFPPRAQRVCIQQLHPEVLRPQVRLARAHAQAALHQRARRPRVAVVLKLPCAGIDPQTRLPRVQLQGLRHHLYCNKHPSAEPYLFNQVVLLAAGLERTHALSSSAMVVGRQHAFISSLHFNGACTEL